MRKYFPIIKNIISEVDGGLLACLSFPLKIFSLQRKMFSRQQLYFKTRKVPTTQAWFGAQSDCHDASPTTTPHNHG
ncbi:hypothetical protein N9L31_00185 [bacterium]|nr:hypothetical protein [bacterium]